MNLRLHSGNWILYIAGLFLAFIFTLLGLFMRENLSLSAVNYYDDELNYEKRKLALADGALWLEGLKLTKTNETLFISFPDKFDFTNSKLYAKLYFPSNDGLDRNIELVPGVYNQKIPLESNLPFHFTIEVYQNGKHYIKQIKY